MEAWNEEVSGGIYNQQHSKDLQGANALSFCYHNNHWKRKINLRFPPVFGAYAWLSDAEWLDTMPFFVSVARRLPRFAFFEINLCVALLVV